MGKALETRAALVLVRTLRAARRQLRILRGSGGASREEEETLLKAMRILENEFSRYRNGEK
jgi:hypothetical protein